MNIINKSRDLTKREIYKLTKGPSTSVQDAVGMEIKVDCWLLYSDVNAKGEEVEILAILADDGSVYSTISGTFKRTFEEILEIFEDEELPEILIQEGTSKNNRSFAFCTIV
jgi:hypothetical protein